MCVCVRPGLLLAPRPSAAWQGKLTEKVKRSTFRSVTVPVERTPAGGGPEPRSLPPGQMLEYYEQYKMEVGKGAAVAFPTFWKASICFHCDHVIQAACCLALGSMGG